MVDCHGTEFTIPNSPWPEANEPEAYPCGGLPMANIAGSSAGRLKFSSQPAPISGTVHGSL
jgi:hypothetical protein